VVSGVHPGIGVLDAVLIPKWKGRFWGVFSSIGFKRYGVAGCSFFARFSHPIGLLWASLWENLARCCMRVVYALVITLKYDNFIQFIVRKQ